MDFATQALVTLPPGCAPDAVTSDGHVVAFWPQPDGLRFAWDGVPGELLDDLVVMRDKTSVLFCSDDGAHLAYVGLRGEGLFVGRDGGEDAPVEAFSRSRSS